MHAVARKPRTRRPYLLRGLVRCGMCERRMQGNWNHEEAYDRCRFPHEYALPETLEHPKVVYLREALVIPPLDRWISTLFHPGKRRGDVSGAR
jgi:site-specific DNA recombinase